MAEMNRYKILRIVVTVRGDAQIMVMKPNRKREMVSLTKTEVDLLKKYFQVADGKDLQDKVFTYEERVFYYDKVIKKFIEKLKSSQN